MTEHADVETSTATPGPQEPETPTAADDDTVEAAPTASLQVAEAPVPAKGPQTPPPRRTGIFVEPESLRTHVGELLRATLGGYEVDQNGNFTFVHQGARVFVTVNMSQVGPQVGVFSITNIGLELTPELSHFLLTTNHKLGFGAFSWDDANNAVWLRHSLLGTMLDAPELQSSVVTVAAAAAHFDDVIHAQFGGQRFDDATADEQQATHPPEAPQDPAPVDGVTNASGYL